MGDITAFGLEIPGSALRLEGFRAWVASLGDDAPRVCYSGGNLHVEMNAQSYETHAPLVDAIGDTLAELARRLDLGRYYRPPSWFTDEAAGLRRSPTASC